MKFDFGEVLTRTWKIGWNHKVLWLWQMLPALTAIVFVPLFFISDSFFTVFMQGPLSGDSSSPWLLTAFGLIAFFLFMIPSIFFAVMIQLTTTYGALKVEKGAEKLSFTELFRESIPYFWRVLGLYAIFGGVWMVIWVGFTAFFAVGVMAPFGLGLLCVIPFFLVLIPVVLVGYSILELAQAAIVADDMSVVDAISHGWKLFRINWLGVVLLMLLLFVAMYFLSTAASIPMMFPMFLLQFGMGMPGDANTDTNVLLVIFITIAYGMTYMVQGILMAFFQTGWAVAYLRMNQNDSITPIILEEKP